MAQPSLIYRRSALAFPFDVPPGFDPLHPASRGMGSTRGCSGVASGANFVSLLPGTPFTQSGTTTAPITEFGPTVAATGAGFVNCAQATATTGTNCTLAWIFSLKSVSGNVTLFQDSSGSNTLFCNTDATLGSYNGSVTSSGIALTANVPYFVIASQLSSNITWFVVNLKTGQMLSTAGTTWGFGGVSSPISICGTSAHQWNGNMAAVMFSPAALNRQQCLQWCADPWSFWYPRGSTSVIAAASAGGSFLAAWARNSNLPVIGTGNY